MGEGYTRARHYAADASVAFSTNRRKVLADPSGRTTKEGAFLTRLGKIKQNLASPCPLCYLQREAPTPLAPFRLSPVSFDLSGGFQ